VSGAGYTRKEVQWNSAIANIDATYSSKITNANTIGSTTKILKWPGATGTISANWGTVTTIGIFDSGTVGEGNLLWFGPLSSAVTLTTGDTFTIPNASLTLTLG